jgi:hypothetical protein
VSTWLAVNSLIQIVPAKSASENIDVPVERLAWHDKLELNPIDGRST